EHTNLSEVQEGDDVNLEFDIIGKYVAKLAGRTLPF
ncbi:MAG: riboflavin synthase, partial [Flavobacterium sp.]